jgi:hypothetical protein
MPDASPKTTERDFLRVAPPGCCYVCQRPIGIFTWTDRNGKAHPWCIPSQRPKWEAARGA